MKLKTLSAAVLATLAASASYANDVTVYGKGNVTIQSIEETYPTALGLDDKDNFEIRSNASRLGVKGSLDITETLKAIYKLEYEVFIDEDNSGNNGSQFNQRNTYVGLQGSAGTFIVGRHDTPTKLAQGKVDRFNDLFAGDIKNFMAGEQREDNVMLYSSPKLADAITISVAAIPGEDDEGAAEPDDGLADYTSASVVYETDMLYLALATDQDIDNSDIIRFVGEFRGDGFKVGAIVQTAEESDDGGMGGFSGGTPVRIASDVDDIEEQDAYVLNGEIKLSDAVALKAQYGFSESSHVTVSDDTEITQTAIGVDYKLSKAAKVYAYWSNITAENDALSSDIEHETLGVGTEIKF